MTLLLSARYCIGTALMVAAMTAPALAADPQFVGTWGKDKAQCKLAQEVAGAPVIFTAKGYDRHETHCAFTSIKPSGRGAWKIVADCKVEGSSQKDTFALAVRGATLHWSHGKSSTKLIRCR